MSNINPPDNEGFDNEDSFDNFDTGDKKSTLGKILRENPMAKIGVVVVAVVAIFGTIIMFGGNNAEKPAVSMVPEGAEITSPPGTADATPAYVEAVKEQNEVRTETAIREGTSSLPTPIEPPVGRVAVPEQAAGEEDPLQRWRRLQEERLQRELQRTQTLAPEEVVDEAQDANRQQAIQAMAQAMAQQMQAILQTKTTIKVQTRKVTEVDFIEALKDAEEKAAGKSSASDAINIEEIIIPAGEIGYAELITEANSDVPGPVLAQIAGGPLSGARILGSFQKRDELLTLSFDTVVLDGISYKIDAVAMDPETTLPGMATDVDHHYLKRIVLPAAAAFVEGMANAISESGLTTITINGDTATSDTQETDSDQEVAAGVDKAGEKLGEIIDDMAEDTQVTVIIKAGTAIGLLYLEPVIKREDQGTTKAVYRGNGDSGTASAAQEVATTNAEQ